MVLATSVNVARRLSVRNDDVLLFDGKWMNYDCTKFDSLLEVPLALRPRRENHGIPDYEK